MTLSTQATGDVPQCPDCGQYMYGPVHYCGVGRAPPTIAGASTAYTDDRVRAVITRIAADHEKTGSGHRKRMTRHEMVTLARQVCLEMGWEWSRKHA